MVAPRDFYYFIGRIALVHAGIEHDIKSALIEDWKIPESKVEGLHGYRLRNFFLESIKDLNVPKKYNDEYIKLINRFWEACNKRNELIKAPYGLTHEKGEILRYNPKERGKYDPEMEFKEWLEKGGKVITTEELKELANDLGQIRSDFFNLSTAVYESMGIYYE